MSCDERAPDGAEAAWHAAVGKVLRGRDPESLTWHRPDGIALKPLYPAHQGSEAPAGAAQRWRVAQRVDHPDPAEANLLALADLEGGADALTLVHADAPSARGFGLPMHTQADLDAVLGGVNIEAIELRLDPGPHGVAWANALAEVAARRRIPVAALRLDLGIDPVSMMATRSAPALASPAGLAEAARAAAGLLDRAVPSAAFRADGRVWNDAGGSDAQELAAVLASGVLYLRALESAGIDLDAARHTISFCLGAEADPVPTIAKFRALRRLWAGIEAACGLAPQPIRLHGETAWRMMTAVSSHTNIIRATAACFGAALGGADGVTVLPFTLPLGLPDAFARRLARNTHHVLAEESNLWRVADPAGGAGLIEALTGALSSKAWALFREIEGEGGIVESLAAGLLQKRFAAVRIEREARLAEGRDALVGATIFAAENEVPGPVFMRAPTAQASPPAATSDRLDRRRAAEPYEIAGATP